MADMTTRLYFAEHAFHVDDMLRRGFRDDGQWLALGPSAMHRLSKEGLAYFIPEDFCTRGELEEACVLQFERMTQACRKLDILMMEKDSFLSEWGIRPFFFHLWQLGQVFDSIYRCVFQSQKILEHFGGAEVFVHADKPKPWPGFGMGFSQEETLWGRVLALPGWHGAVTCLPADTNQAKPASAIHALRRTAFSYIKRSPFFSTMAESLRCGLKENIYLSMKLQQKEALAVLNHPYEWAGIFPEYMRRGFPIQFLCSRGLPVKKDAASVTEENVLLEGSLWKIFRESFQDGELRVDFLELMRDRFAFIVHHSASTAKRTVRALEKFTGRRKTRCLLFSESSDFGSYVIKQYFRRKNIPVLSWQHGAEWYNKRITQRNDVLNLVSCDTMLVYGDGVKYAYESSPLAREEQCRVVSAGMPSLMKLMDIKRKNKQDKKNILWVFGGYYGNGWYCGFSPPLSDTLYYKEQIVILRGLLELMERRAELKLTVKLYPSQYLNQNPPWVEDIKENPRVRLVYDKPSFTGLLREHDMVIIDLPTTTLLQSVATKLPVFVLMSLIGWPDEALQVLKQRAYCALDAREIISCIEKFLDGGEGSVDTENQNFLKYYGIHNGQAVRSVTAVVDNARCAE